MRAGEPGSWRCVRGGALTPKSVLRRAVHLLIGPPMHRPLGRQSAGIPLRRGLSGTKTRFETHAGWCRARRKRKRLTSNGSIESDAAVPVTFQRKFLLHRKSVV